MTSNKKNIIITQIINIENVINALTKDFTPEEWEDEVNYLSIVKKSLNCGNVLRALITKP